MHYQFRLPDHPLAVGAEREVVDLTDPAAVLDGAEEAEEYQIVCKTDEGGSVTLAMGLESLCTMYKTVQQMLQDVAKEAG